jgi:hypothetical protein
VRCVCDTSSSPFCHNTALPSGNCRDASQSVFLCRIFISYIYTKKSFVTKYWIRNAVHFQGNSFFLMHPYAMCNRQRRKEDTWNFSRHCARKWRHSKGMFCFSLVLGINLRGFPCRSCFQYDFFFSRKGVCFFVYAAAPMAKIFALPYKIVQCKLFTVRLCRQHVLLITNSTKQHWKLPKTSSLTLSLWIP